MPSLGQSSGAWLGNSSALRILYRGFNNSLGLLGDDAYTQTNPPAVASNVTDQVDTRLSGILSGSVCFSRPDLGNDYISGPGSAAAQAALQADATLAAGYRALGVFINNANGNAFENQPGIASGRGPYTTGFGSFGNGLFETVAIANTADAGNSPAGTTLTYTAGFKLVASRNGYLMPTVCIGGDGGVDNADVVACTAESYVANTASSATVIGVLKQGPDSIHNELIYDQRL